MDRLPSATSALLAPLRLFAGLVRNRAQLLDQNSKRNIVVAIDLEAEASTQRIFYVSELAGLLRLACALDLVFQGPTPSTKPH